jgi:serine/threonine protein kinase
MAEGEPPYMQLPQAKALFLISTEGAPPLKKPKQWSEEFRNFLSLCLVRDPRKRISAIELLQVTAALHCITLILYSQHSLLLKAASADEFKLVVQKVRGNRIPEEAMQECLIS